MLMASTKVTLFSIVVPVQDIHSFLTCAQDVNESIASHPNRFNTRTRTPTYTLNRTLDRLDRSLVTITTELSRLLQLDDYED